MLCLAGYKPVLTHCVRCGKDLRKQKEGAFSKVQGGTLCDYCGVGCRVISALSAEALRRKGYQVKKGHRQFYTALNIDTISA